MRLCYTVDTDILTTHCTTTIQQYIQHILTNDKLNCIEFICNYRTDDNTFVVTNTTIEYNVLDMLIELLKFTFQQILQSNDVLFETVYKTLTNTIVDCVKHNMLNMLSTDVTQLDTYKTTYTESITQFQEQLNQFNDTIQTPVLIDTLNDIDTELFHKIEYYVYDQLKQLIIDNNFEIYHKHIDTTYFTQNNELCIQVTKLLNNKTNELLNDNTTKCSETIIHIIHLLFESICYYTHCMNVLNIHNVNLQEFLHTVIQLYDKLYTNYYTQQFNTILYMNLLYINDTKLFIEYLLLLQKLLIFEFPTLQIDITSDIEYLEHAVHQQYKQQVQHNRSNIHTLLQSIDIFNDEQCIDIITQVTYNIQKLQKQYVQLLFDCTEFVYLVDYICSYFVTQISQLTEISVENNETIDVMLASLIEQIDSLNIESFNIKQHKLYQLYLFIRPSQSLALLSKELLQYKYDQITAAEAKQLVIALYEISEKRDNILALIEKTLM